MRPLKIRMQAFGPFAGSEIVDFTKLGERSFFLIHGPTGAGKTTLLDALCFALYGDTSGGERDARAMRSDHAAPDLATEVELEFSLGATRYRVLRSPAQSRPKLRGEGRVEVAASAELYVWKDEDWAPLVQQSNKVSERVRELIGFDGAQFRQLIVLPQGRFREVLSADSKGRQAIMERLFRTELYSRVERALKDASSGLVSQVQQLNEQRTGILNQVQADSEAALDEALAARSSELSRAETEENAARESLAQARAAREAGRQTALLFAERDASVQAHAELNSRRDEEMARCARITLARRAEILRPLDQHRALSLAAQSAKAAELARAQSAAREADADAQSARQALAAEDARESEREAAQRRVTELEAASDAWARWDEARSGRSKAEEAFKVAESGLSALHTERDALTQGIELQQQELLAEQTLAAGEATHRARHEELDRQIRLLDELGAASRACSEAGRTLAESETQLAAASQTCLAARAARTRSERDWIAGQAARLAALLETGSPCPVCGGRDHPAPAHRGSEIVSDEALEAARSAVLTAELAEQRARDTLQRARAADDQAKGRLALLTEALGDAAHMNATALREQAEAAKLAWQAALTATAEIDARVLHLKSANDSLAQKEEQIRAQDALAMQCRARLADCAGRLEAATAAVPETLRESGALDKARRKALEEKATLLASLAAARSREQHASARNAALNATLNAAQKNVGEAATTAGQALAAFVAGLSGNGFADETVWREALMADDALLALEEQSAAFGKALAAAADRVRRATVAVADKTAPDLATQDEALRAAEQHAADAASRSAKIRHDKEELARASGNLVELARQSSEIEARYAVLGRMAEIANGANPRRISFQRYVLATLLDEVLEAASVRLLRMSRSRYALQRITSQGDLRSAGGLDLEVFDHQTGCSRPANTLSGGEGFLASLSLALGLADVVQSRTGGIQLETLFVDEGFGTLDPESLDFAIDTLIGLQQGGRLVGIISHVAELKERIDTRLEVRPGEKGSHIVLIR
ncbi:AAA family ATPase [Niveibacterium terrae]|uniref:AAA family ATPase n=1 Tax=Niveibacterium terrae TaxID=3373598 RepID=UPI003A8CA25B